MDPFTLAAILGISVDAASQLIGMNAEQEGQDKAERSLKAALSGLAIDAPKELDAVKFQQLGPSAMAGVNADPNAVEMQREALRGLQEAATTQGLTGAEQADFQDAMNQAAQYEQGQRGAIMDNANARGIGGSGLELAQRLAAEQGGAQRASQAAQQASAAAARRQALAQMQLGQQAGAFRSQGFGEDASRAGAQDAVSRFNTQGINDFNAWRYGQQQNTRDKMIGVQEDLANLYDQSGQRKKKNAQDMGEKGAGYASAFGSHFGG